MKQFDNLNIIKKEKIPVSLLLSEQELNLTCVTGNLGLENCILNANIHRPQLALAGYVELFTFDRVQLFGNTEIYYLKSLPLLQRVKAMKKIFKFSIPCIVVTNGNKFDKEIVELAKEHKIPILTTQMESTETFSVLSSFLGDQFAEQATVHGSFVDVYGVGMLFTGRSGIGKSEIALDLVERGHRIVADDIVMFTNNKKNVLMGTGTNLVQHFMEIRGLGIIDIRQMFGIRSIRFQKRLEIIVELEDWDEEKEYNRTGLDDEEPTNIMGVNIQTVKLPIFPGKNITVIAEVIAINYLLRTYGYNAAEVFSEKLNESIKKKTQNFNHNDNRTITYFQGDIE